PRAACLRAVALPAGVRADDDDAALLALVPHCEVEGVADPLAAGLVAAPPDGRRLGRSPAGVDATENAIRRWPDPLNLPAEGLPAQIAHLRRQFAKRLHNPACVLPGQLRFPLQLSKIGHRDRASVLRAGLDSSAHLSCGPQHRPRFRPSHRSPFGLCSSLSPLGVAWASLLAWHFFLPAEGRRPSRLGRSFRSAPEVETGRANDCSPDQPREPGNPGTLRPDGWGRLAWADLLAVAGCLLPGQVSRGALYGPSS